MSEKLKTRGADEPRVLSEETALQIRAACVGILETAMDRFDPLCPHAANELLQQGDAVLTILEIAGGDASEERYVLGVVRGCFDLVLGEKRRE